MTKLKLIGAALALALPTAAFAAAPCCADMACCKDGADCCDRHQEPTASFGALLSGSLGGDPLAGLPRGL